MSGKTTARMSECMTERMSDHTQTQCQKGCQKIRQSQATDQSVTHRTSTGGGGRGGEDNPDERYDRKECQNVSETDDSRYATAGGVTQSKVTNLNRFLCCVFTGFTMVYRGFRLQPSFRRLTWDASWRTNQDLLVQIKNTFRVFTIDGFFSAAFC